MHNARQMDKRERERARHAKRGIERKKGRGKDGGFFVSVTDCRHVP